MNNYDRKPIKSFYSALAGVTFENRQSLVKNLYVGQSLILQRMPNNPYDSNAIAVYDSNSMQQVGFIRKRVAENLAPIMDRNDRYVSCTVKEITGGGNLSTGVNILIEIFERSVYYIDVDETNRHKSTSVSTNWDTTYEHAMDVYKGFYYFDTGMRYMKGEGVTKDEKQAFYWIHEAAKRGYVAAQRFLGMMYATGSGVEQNLSEAFSLIYKAAMQEDAEAQYLVGEMYSDGFGVEKDDKKAFEWLLKSACQGFIKAQFMVGIKYITGVGVEKDLKKAAVWFERAAIQGDRNAQYSLGAMYERGDYFDKNDELAISWYEKSAIQGCEEAQERLIFLNKR